MALRPAPFLSNLAKTYRISPRCFSSSNPNQQEYKPRPNAKFFPIRKDTFLPADTYKDKVVLVTGGGTGLGKGMTKKFAELGAKVAIASRRMPVLEETAKEIIEQTGGVVMPVQLDIRDPEAIRVAVDSIESSLGLPDVVIHNAAGNFISPSERLSPNAFQTILDIVLKGTAFLTLDVGKRMIKQEKGGTFLAVTTTYLNEGSAFVVPSACAKSGVETLAKSLGVEWGRYGIRGQSTLREPLVGWIQQGILSTKCWTATRKEDSVRWLTSPPSSAVTMRAGSTLRRSPWMAGPTGVSLGSSDI